MDDRLFSIYEELLEKNGSRLREEIAQELFGIRISLQRFIIARGHEENLTHLKGMLDHVIRQVSEVANELHPSILAQIGFVQAVDDLIYHSFSRQTKIRCQVDRRIQSETHHFQLNCYRILQDVFFYLNAYPDSGTVQLKILVKDQEVRISLDGFLNSEAIEREKDDLGLGLNAILESRLALYSGELDVSFRKKRSLLMIKIYLDNYDNSIVGGRPSHRKKRH